MIWRKILEWFRADLSLETGIHEGPLHMDEFIDRIQPGTTYTGIRQLMMIGPN